MFAGLPRWCKYSGNPVVNSWLKFLINCCHSLPNIIRYFPTGKILRTNQNNELQKQMLDVRVCVNEDDSHWIRVDGDHVSSTDGLAGRTYVMKQSGWKLSSAWDNFSSHKDYWESDATDKPFLNRKTKMKMTHLFGGNKRKTKRSDFPSTPLVRSVGLFQLWGRARFRDTRCASQEGVRADFVEFWSSKEFLFPHALALRRSDKIR